MKATQQPAPIPTAGLRFIAAGQFGHRKAAKITSGNLAGSSDRVRITGLVCPYDVVSMDLGGFREVYYRGCFQASIASEDPRVLFNHNPEYVLGRKSAGTALFYDAADGLHVDVDPPETMWADNSIISMDRGDINDMGIGGMILQYHWENRSGDRVRVIEKARLIQASVVSFGLYESAVAKTQQPGALAAGSFFVSEKPSQKGSTIQ